MKQEIPSWAIFGAVALGLVVLAGVFMFAGRTGPASADRQKVEQEHAKIVQERYESNFEATADGSGSQAARPEELAREKYGGE